MSRFFFLSSRTGSAWALLLLLQVSVQLDGVGGIKVHLVYICSLRHRVICRAEDLEVLEDK